MAPGYFSILKAAVGGGTRRLLTEQEGTLQDSVEQLLFGQGRLLLSKSRSLHSTIGHSNSLLQGGSACSGRSGSAANQSSSLTAFGALYRTLSTPSASGPSFQICGYHVDCLLQSLREGSINSKPQKAPTAAYSVTSSSINNVAQRCGQPRGRGSANFNGRLTIIGNFDSCRKSSMILKGKQNVYLVRGYFTFNGPSRWKSDSWLGSNLRESHSSSSASVSTDATSDAPFDNSAQLPNYPVSSEQKAPGDRILKLVSGSCYLPHPDKESTGGEDAHFICDDEQAIGVADGVGGWADLGVNAGLFAQELMSHSVNAIHEEPKGLVDPSRVLGKAHSSTKARGSSTACIIALTEKGLHAINLGDSGFMVVRDGCTIFRSPVQQHDFNFTYQLESGNGGDLPSSGQVFSVSVAPGDVIIAGTDGLFDNLYNNEVTAVVVHAVRAGLGPQVTAQKIAALARQRAQDRDRQTPFSTAAQDAGLRYYGGKLDDITVVVSFITSMNGGRST